MITIKIDGLDKLRGDLSALSVDVHRAVAGSLHEAAYIVEGKAKSLVLEGPKTGRLYTRGKSVVHQASAPGEAPATDEGNLVNSIQQDVDEAALEARVSAKTPYAEALEYGTKKMEPRPFMRPALDQSERLILEEIATAIARAVK